MVRLKNRYMICEMCYTTGGGPDTVYKISGKDVLGAVKAAIVKCHGDFGMGSLKRSLSVKYLNNYTKIVIIRGTRGPHRMLVSSLEHVKEIMGYPVTLNIFHIGGTIRSCQKVLVKYNRKKLVEILDQTTDPEKREKIKERLERCQTEGILKIDRHFMGHQQPT